MIIGVIASNSDECRFFAVSAENTADAIKLVTRAIGSNFSLRTESLEEVVCSQYNQLAELTTN